MRNVFTEPVGDLGICINSTNDHALRADECTLLKKEETDISTSYHSTRDYDADATSSDTRRSKAFAVAVAISVTFGSFYAILYFWNNKESILKRFQIN